MRIIAGSAKGRRISAPDTADTRPISDRMKEALFNILGDIEGLSFLDTYAGSGTVGLEAISRGASSVTAVDSGSAQAAAIRQNASSLGFDERLKVEQMPLQQWLRNCSDVFDIVFADPPFDDIEADTLRSAAARAKRLFILKYPSRQKPVEIPDMEMVRNRKYGNSSLAVYKT